MIRGLQAYPSPDPDNLIGRVLAAQDQEGEIGATLDYYHQHNPAVAPPERIEESYSQPSALYPASTAGQKIHGQLTAAQKKSAYRAANAQKAQATVAASETAPVGGHYAGPIMEHLLNARNGALGSAQGLSKLATMGLYQTDLRRR